MDRGGGQEAAGVLGKRGVLAPVAVALPAWQPDDRLVALVEALVAAGFCRLIAVDDGSSAESEHVFARLRAMPEVTLCRHAENLGKGRALKTAFAEVLRQGGEIIGVVTADADGQHVAEDIVRVARQLMGAQDGVVLGVRDFTGTEVPWRSRFGNLLTRVVFRVLSGRVMQDTQTGLRGLPRKLLPTLLGVAGERYEYEMVMLAALCRERVPIAEVPIRTIYLEDNRGSHFRPVPDSVRVYGALLRFYVRAWRQGGRTRKRDKQRLRAA